MTATTITAEKLTALTGLSDARHRKIAAAGYFPPPVRGQYCLTETVRGLFRFFVEQETEFQKIIMIRELLVQK